MRIMIFLCTLLLITASCGNREKVKEKIRAVKEAVAEKQSEKKRDKVNEESSITSTQSKALDRENPWYAKDFRMELTVKLAGGQNNVEIQKSGNVLYYHVWNSAGGGEKLYVMEGDEIKVYFINTKNKTAQLQRTYTDDYNTVFCNHIGEVNGIVFKQDKKKNESKKDNGLVDQKNQESVEVTNETRNGFDCEKIVRITETQNDLSAGMNALGSLLGKKEELEGAIKELKVIKKTDITWIEKNSGAVVGREFKVEGAGAMAKVSEQSTPQPDVKLLTFSPDASLIPASLEGYKLVE